MRNRSFLLIALLGLSGCGDWTTTVLTLSNDSGQLVSDVSANFAGDERSADRINPGQFVVLASHAGGEGMVCLTYRQGGVMRHYPIDYITKNRPSRYKITIRDRDILVADSLLFDPWAGKASVDHPLPVGTKCVP